MIEGVQTYAFYPDLRKHAPSPEYEVDEPAKVVLYLSQRQSLYPAYQDPLYTMSAVPSAAKKDPEKKLALAEAIAGLVNQLEVMTGTAAAPASAAVLLHSIAPVPDEVLAGKRVFVMDDPNRESEFISGADWIAPFSDDLRASNRYTVLSSAKVADLVLQLSFNAGLRVRVLDGSTMKQLWTVDNPKFYYPGFGKKLRRNQAAGTASAFLALR